VGGHQKPGPEGSRNLGRGGGGHVEGPLAAGDPQHDILGAWLL
jgi:hypothetical protein